jgi:hypothetical protein
VKFGTVPLASYADGEAVVPDIVLSSFRGELGHHLRATLPDGREITSTSAVDWIAEATDPLRRPYMTLVELLDQRRRELHGSYQPELP